MEASRLAQAALRARSRHPDPVVPAIDIASDSGQLGDAGVRACRAGPLVDRSILASPGARFDADPIVFGVGP